MSYKLLIASMMVCGTPNLLKNRLILSCSDSVWSPIQTLPVELKRYFTDELGNSAVNYGGFVQMVDVHALGLLAEHGLFACFRCITENYLEQVQVYPPKAVYQKLIDDLIPMGWDISTGNGWLSASCHGCFPIDPYTGDEIDQHADKINKFGLFFTLDDCLTYCQTNNSLIPEHAPWFPVGIYVDKSSYARLSGTLCIRH
ncbi:MAG: hypothetical protein HXX11_06745 [Desulfuromonadales bacterium]|nr:hypothetical protein [Desulfuromonadales bacterium]